MRIIIHTQYYPPEMGAPQARLSELARRFVERGHDVIVLTAMPNYPSGRIYPGYGGLFRRQTQGGVSIFRTCIYPTKSVGMLRRLANYFSFVSSSLSVGAAALPQADVLFTECPPLFLGLPGYLLSRWKGARWVFNVSDLWLDSAVRLGVVREGLSLRLARTLEEYCYKKAWLICGQSNEIIEDIRLKFPQVSTYHLSNGVDPRLFFPERRTPEMRRALADGKSCVAIYAGLHGVAQGLEQVLEAAARLRDVKELGIVMVGDGPEKERLVRKARTMELSNVRFLDPYRREEMPSLLASADIALVPLKENLPGAVPSKIYEAMGAGLPIVLMATGEAAGIVQQAQAGVVAPPGDAQTVASALRDLVQNTERRKQLGAHGRQAAMVRFNRQAIADGFIDFLEERLPC